MQTPCALPGPRLRAAAGANAMPARPSVFFSFFFSVHRFNSLSNLNFEIVFCAATVWDTCPSIGTVQAPGHAGGEVTQVRLYAESDWQIDMVRIASCLL